jgi:hypothetical protein
LDLCETIYFDEDAATVSIIFGVIKASLMDEEGIETAK